MERVKRDTAVYKRKRIKPKQCSHHGDPERRIQAKKKWGIIHATRIRVIPQYLPRKATKTNRLRGSEVKEGIEINTQLPKRTSETTTTKKHQDRHKAYPNLILIKCNER